MGLLGAFQDPQFRKDVARGLLDAGNRGAVAGLLGGPVDLATMALRPLGYNVEQPVGGSEWIGQKMQNLGLVSEKRNPLAEGLAAFAGPMAAQQIAPKVFAAELRAMENMAKPSPMNAATRGQAGMIKYPYGRVPETLDERMQLRDLLTRNAENSGYRVEHDAAQTGASLYSTITNPTTGAEAIVRLSDHAPAMKYVPGQTPYFSVDPTLGEKTVGGTFEQAINFLAKHDLPIKNLGPRYQGIPSMNEIVAARHASEADAYSQAQKARTAMMAQAAQESGGAHLVSTKVNSGGRRYDVFKEDGSKVTAYSRDIPDELKTGDRNALIQFILNRP